MPLAPFPMARPLPPEEFDEAVETAALDHALSDDVDIKDLRRTGVPRGQAVALHCAAHSRAIRRLLGTLAPSADRDEMLALVRQLVDPATPDRCEGQG